MNILGLTAWFHDSSACLVRDGVVVSAAQEERFDRQKGSAAFPARAIDACLQAGGITMLDVDHVVFYEKPFLKFERVLIDHARAFPSSFPHFLRSMPAWLGERLVLPLKLKADLAFGGSTLFVKHHLAHAASAFLASPCEEAAVLTVDGVGEWASTTWGVGRGNRLEIQGEVRYPHSLGLVYTALTTYLGFEANRGEGKVMALGDYGQPAYLDELRKIVTLCKDGSYRLEPGWFTFSNARSMFSRRFVKRFGPPRLPGTRLEARHYDLAASLQALLEEALLGLARHVAARTGLKNLCLAGGVGLNCVANSRVLTEAPFERLWVQPAAGDSGTALGAALYAWCGLLGQPRRFVMRDAYLGPAYALTRIQRAVAAARLQGRRMEQPALLEHVARRLAQGRIVGWFEGRMEFGPRALGHRSVLADPRQPGMKDLLNSQVKHREGFRPYGASVLREELGQWFQPDMDSPYMLFALKARPEKVPLVPAAVHVDGTCRLQTVTRAEHGRFHGLIEEFHRITGVPMLINTSFNDDNEPIVCTPEDALACFRRTGLDTLVLEDLVLDREERGQP
jgi:carbamoyltransferase